MNPRSARAARAIVLVLLAAAWAPLLIGCAPAEGFDDATPQGGVYDSRRESVIDCMTVAGWVPELLWDGGLHFDAPPEQSALLNETLQECSSTAVTHYPDPIYTDEQKRELYQRELEHRRCIEEYGFTLEEPPSEQQYLDSFERDRWLVYPELQRYPELTANQGEEEREILTACPPPAWAG